MRLVREMAATPSVVQENEVVTACRLATKRTGSGHLDFESIVLRIAKTIEPDTRKLMVWYQDTPIMVMDALTAERLVHLGRGREVIAFLNGIRVGVGL
jgi:hypothetical protein